MADIPLKVHLESNSCICPCQSYTCHWYVTPHQLWSVSSPQYMVQNVWTITLQLPSVERGMSHVVPLVMS